MWELGRSNEDQKSLKEYLTEQIRRKKELLARLKALKEKNIKKK